MKKITLTLALLVMSSLVFAQDVEKKDALKGETSPAIESLRLASDLVNYGYKQQSALPLIDALQILMENPTEPVKADREGEKVDINNKKGKSGTIEMDIKTIISDAREFADGDKELLSLIDKLESENSTAHRGAVNGPYSVVEYVNANSTDRYNISFISGYVAEIAVVGDGDTDLDLYVYDSNGHLIASDTDYTDRCYVSWVPAWTGRFIVKIMNRGAVYNKYVLMTN